MRASRFRDHLLAGGGDRTIQELLGHVAVDDATLHRCRHSETDRSYDRAHPAPPPDELLAQKRTVALAEPLAEQNMFGGIGKVLSRRDFAIYWSSNGVNTVGRWMYRIAAWLAWG